MASNQSTQSRRSAHSDLSQSILASQLPDALLKVQTVSAVTGLSASTIHRKVAASSFPKPIRLGARCTRWKSREVAEWVRAQG